MDMSGANERGSEGGRNKGVREGEEGWGKGEREEVKEGGEGRSEQRMEGEKDGRVCIAILISHAS